MREIERQRKREREERAFKCSEKDNKRENKI